MLPSQFKPITPEDFLPPAREAAFFLRNAIAQAKHHGAALKFSIHGPPGTGKSQLARFVARELAVPKWSQTILNGTQLKIEEIEKLRANLHLTDLFGEYRILIIDEFDVIAKNPTAQKALYSFLDEVEEHPKTAVVCTCNSDYHELQPALQTRYQPIALTNTPTEILAAWLETKWGLPHYDAQMIALGSAGNVRAAGLDATSFLQRQPLPVAA